VDARNLFDVRTATYDGVLGPVREPIGDAYQYPLPGRSFLVSVRWSR
jgi:outer membrane receptor protein involved in Fe transport